MLVLYFIFIFVEVIKRAFFAALLQKWAGDGREQDAPGHCQYVKNMKERIRQIMEHERMSQQEFAAKLEISPASLSSIFTGRTNPTNKHVQAIHRAFPDINIKWLLFGEEEMYTHPKGEAIDEKNGNTEDTASSGECETDNTVCELTSPPPQTENRERKESSRYYRSETPLSPVGFQPFIKNEQESNIRKRQIKEIRVFFDDGTYEAFVPSK